VRTTVLVLLLLGALPAAAAPVKSPSHARASGGGGGQSLSLWGVLDPGPIDGAGVGGRFAFPIAPQGLLHSPTVRDELVLELGLDFVHYRDQVGWYPGPYIDYSWNGLLMVGGVAWNFWFTPRFAAYPKIDLGWWFGWYRGWDDRYAYYTRRDFDGIFLQGAGGLIYRFDSVAFRLELGTDLVRVGVAFPL
jgi:hypothetical protein